MMSTTGIEKQLAWSGENQAILPIMTAIFVDGLGPDRHSQRFGAKWLHTASRTQGAINVFHLPVAPFEPLPRSDDAVGAGGACAAAQVGDICRKSMARHTAVRLLIRGISHHFNNLLMGIWGNATLIRLQLEEDDALYDRVVQMEQLIQSGAFLIHMVLGYLGERRTAAKRIRLNQLISEIKGGLAAGFSGNDPWNFEARLKWASRVQRPRMIASSTARVLEVLFQGIEAHCKDIMIEKAGFACIEKKLRTIDCLVTRGLEITNQLRLYAGDYKPRKTRIQLGPLVERLIARLSAHYPQVTVKCEVSPKLPGISADRARIEWAMQQLLINGFQAMPEGGTLQVAVHGSPEEAVQRNNDRRGAAHVVVTIKDSGKAITTPVQAHVFEPFFAFPCRRHGLDDLGLAAADGILKSHAGFIRVYSRQSKGSTFKLYFPINRAEIAEQPVKRQERLFEAAYVS